ncbi:MAG: cupredoxin domain-containing protein [Armatimonadota bacterium]|nr:cupredoxin domain-containing protein [Armatimonadota bacterium]
MAVAVVALVATGCGVRRAAPALPPAVVDVVAREWAFAPASLAVAAGRIAVRLKNEGLVEHNLVVDGVRGAQIEGVPPGGEATVAFELEPGTYVAYCSIPGHREAGMTLTIRVAR